jgi:hypothetical protein
MPDRVEMWRTIRRIVTLAGLAAAAYFLVVSPMERAMASARATVEHGLDKVLAAVTGSNTRIVEGRAEITGTSDIHELSLLEMRMSATRSFENEGTLLRYLPTGTKRLIIRGDYQVKGGYRLAPGVSLAIEKGRPVARFPKPEILSVELVDFEVLNEEDGLFNKIKPADRAHVLRELREQMREEAARSGMLDTIDGSLRTRLADLLGTESVTLVRELP